jgi:hypothetical protein
VEFKFVAVAFESPVNYPSRAIVPECAIAEADLLLEGQEDRENVAEEQVFGGRLPLRSAVFAAISEAVLLIVAEKGAQWPE